MREVEAFGASRKITLILPSLFSELEGEALPRILDELKKVPFLHQIVIGLDRASREQYIYAPTFFSRLKQDHVVLWNDGPRLRAIDARLQRLALAPSESGKGRNVWFCLGYTLVRQDSSVVAVHDCDVLTYSAEDANAGLSRMNGLHVDRHAEEGAVELRFEHHAGRITLSRKPDGDAVYCIMEQGSRGGSNHHARHCGCREGG